MMCDYELLSKTQFALDWTMFIQDHSAVSIRLLLPIYIYKSLLPQYCVNKGSHYPMYKSLLPQSVANKFVLLPLYMYKSLLPQCCVKVVYYPSTCTSPYCYSAVSITVITTSIHVQVLTATELCL